MAVELGIKKKRTVMKGICKVRINVLIQEVDKNDKEQFNIRKS